MIVAACWWRPGHKVGGCFALWWKLYYSCIVADGRLFSGEFPDAVCLAIICHGYVAGGTHLPHFLPSVAVGHGEDPACAASRLAADLSLDINNHALTAIQHAATSKDCVTQVFLMNVRTPEGDMFPLLEQLDDALAWGDRHTAQPDGKLEWFNSSEATGMAASSQATCMTESMGAAIEEAFSMQGLHTNIWIAALDRGGHKRRRPKPCAGCTHEESGGASQAISPGWGERGSAAPAHHGQKGCRLYESEPPSTPPSRALSTAASPVAAATATPPTRVASPVSSVQDDDARVAFVQDDDALYDEGPSPIVRRYRQQQLQLAPVAPVESPVTSIQCDHPMLVCSAGYSLIEDFSYIPECPDCGKLVHCGHRGFCPELCGCDDYLARYPPDY